MNILITNIWLNNYGGTQVGVRDLAISLHKRGIHVEVYSPVLGTVADEIRSAGIHIVDSSEDLVMKPDLIHAQHFIPTMDAIVRFPGVPVVYFLHDRTHPADIPPKYSQIVKYIAVDDICLDRLIIDNGIDKEKTGVIYNWVDMDRFKLRQNISHKPTKALVFSNFATRHNYFKVIQQACSRVNLELDGLGTKLGNPVKDPENILLNYDLVFAKGKAAMEALATGAGVIVCDSLGLGETVNIKNYEHFRRNSFWMKTFDKPVNIDLIIKEIKKYDSEEILQVSHKIRSEVSFPLYVDNILKFYNESITLYHQRKIKNEDYEDEITIQKYLSQKNATLRKELNTYGTVLPEHLKKSVKSVIEKKGFVQAQAVVIRNLDNEINIIKNSVSYKIGRFLTAPARYLLELFK